VFGVLLSAELLTFCQCSFNHAIIGLLWGTTQRLRLKTGFSITKHFLVIKREHRSVSCTTTGGNDGLTDGQ